MAIVNAVSVVSMGFLTSARLPSYNYEIKSEDIHPSIYHVLPVEVLPVNRK